MSCEKIFDEFRGSVTSYNDALSIEGSSVDIVVTEDCDICIKRNDILMLCNLFISDKISNYELSYIADTTQLCESVDFDEEFVADIIAEFTDPEINGVFTKQRAEQIVSENT